VTELMTYERMALGRRFTPVEFIADAATLAAYRVIAGRVSAAPVGLLAIQARRAYLSEGTMPSGGVMASLEVETLGPMPPDTRLRAAAVVTDRAERKGRGWVTIDVSVTAGPAEFARVRVLGVWPL
jgi:acyl dehydratase